MNSPVDICKVAEWGGLVGPVALVVSEGEETGMKHLSLFSGSGIGTVAAQACGIRTVAHCENDPACCYCLERLWPGVKLFRDVHDVTAESVADLGAIDIISGGFPCQDISTAGKGAGLGTEENKTRSGLWYEFARVIREVRPAWLLIENVPALRVRGGDRVCDDLEAIGYTWEAVVVGADDVGAPHRRKRVWIIGQLANGNERASIASAIGGDSEAVAGVQGQANRFASGVGSRGTSRALADPIGNACGSGRDESERGSEGGIAAGRTGEELGHSASNGQRRPASGERGRPEQTGGSSGDGGELADGECERLEGTGRERREQQRVRFGKCSRLVGSRWPSRPGEPQHEWEAPRLVEFQVGDAVDGMARRVHSRANKAALRMVGNGWCYQVAELMFRAIIQLSGNPG